MDEEAARCAEAPGLVRRLSLGHRDLLPRVGGAFPGAAGLKQVGRTGPQGRVGLASGPAPHPQCPPPQAPYLGTQRTVAFEEVGADLRLAGHVHMAVGAAAVAADALQEVGADGHLRGGGSEAQGSPPATLRALPQAGPTQGSTTRREPQRLAHPNVGPPASPGARPPGPAVT